MATTIGEVRAILDASGLKYVADEESSSILIGFKLDASRTTYRDRDGDADLAIVIVVAEDGEFLALFAPECWSVAGCEHRAAVFEAVPLIQSQYKMLRFDYDPEDGELRPNIEIPLEDSAITTNQFHRAMHGLIHGIMRFDSVLRHAMETGDVRIDLATSPDDGDHDPASNFPGASFSGGMAEFFEQCGGIDALERLIGADPRTGTTTGMDDPTSG